MVQTNRINDYIFVSMQTDNLFPWPDSCFVDDIFSRYTVVHHHVRTFCHCHKVKFSLQWCIIIDKSRFRTCLVSLCQIVFSPEMHLNQVVALTTSVYGLFLYTFNRSQHENGKSKQVGLAPALCLISDIAPMAHT